MLLETVLNSLVTEEVSNEEDGDGSSKAQKICLNKFDLFQEGAV